jgi:hypothetical protein
MLVIYTYLCSNQAGMKGRFASLLSCRISSGQVAQCSWRLPWLLLSHCCNGCHAMAHHTGSARETADLHHAQLALLAKPTMLPTAAMLPCIDQHCACRCQMLLGTCATFSSIADWRCLQRWCLRSFHTQTTQEHSGTSRKWGTGR